MQNRQNDAIAHGIQEAIALPASLEGTGFGFAIANYADDEKVGIIKSGAKSVQERIAQFTALMDGIREMRTAVARHATRGREFAEEEAHTADIHGDFWMHAGVSALEIGVRVQSRPAVARAGDVKGVDIVLFDQAIQVHVNKAETRRSAPMAEKAGLDMFGG